MHYRKHEPPSSLRLGASRICSFEVLDGRRREWCMRGAKEYIARRILRLIDQFTVAVEAVVFIVILLSLSFLLPDAVLPASRRHPKEIVSRVRRLGSGLPQRAPAAFLSTASPSTEKHQHPLLVTHRLWTAEASRHHAPSPPLPPTPPVAAG